MNGPGILDQVVMGMITFLTLVGTVRVLDKAQPYQRRMKPGETIESTIIGFLIIFWLIWYAVLAQDAPFVPLMTALVVMLRLTAMRSDARAVDQEPHAIGRADFVWRLSKAVIILALQATIFGMGLAYA